MMCEFAICCLMATVVHGAALEGEKLPQQKKQVKEPKLLDDDEELMPWQRNRKNGDVGAMPPDARHGDVTTDGTGSQRLWTNVEVWLSIGILVFALAVILIMWNIIRGATQTDARWSPMAVIRAFGLVLIISGAILLVTAGYRVEQISPAMGLLGAVAGYLLGSQERAPQKPEGTPPRAAPGRAGAGTGNAGRNRPRAAADHACHLSRSSFRGGASVERAAE
jgi:hypothetical protein